MTTKEQEAARDYTLKTNWSIDSDRVTGAEAISVEEAFLAGIAWARENPEWISVDERLPEEGVLIAIRGNLGFGDFTATVQRSVENGKSFYDENEGDYSWDESDVKEWHLLPPLPKPEGA